MQTVDVDSLIYFARALDGQTLHTSASNKPFTLRVTAGGLEYTPHSSGQSRPHGRKWLERVCLEFSRTNSFKAGDYHHLSVNASYALAIINQYLENSVATVSKVIIQD